MAVPNVPQQLAEQSVIDLPRVNNPYLGIWWTAQSIEDIPQESLGWLVAQGWEITETAEDATTTPPTISYKLQKQGMQPLQVLLSLCNSYTTAANEARDAIELRYNEVITNWKAMLDSSHTQFESQVAEQNTSAGLYLSDLSSYMDQIDTRVQDLDTAHDAHATTTRSKLDGLGTTDLARIEEEFAASLATQLQQATDRGLSSSALTVDITARNTRDKSQAIAELNDRLNREKVANEHTLFGQKLEHGHRAIAEKMNANVARLQGWRDIHQENMRLMAYQIDERNKLLVGLYSFVERRDDVGPQWQDMAQMIAGLGDSAGGWITP